MFTEDNRILRALPPCAKLYAWNVKFKKISNAVHSKAEIRLKNQGAGYRTGAKVLVVGISRTITKLGMWESNL